MYPNVKSHSIVCPFPKLLPGGVKGNFITHIRKMDAKCTSIIEWSTLEDFIVIEKPLISIVPEEDHYKIYYKVTDQMKQVC